VREQVITPRGGRVGAGSKARAGERRASSGRGARADASKGARQKSFEWKAVLPYVPLALKVLLAVSLGVLAYVGYRTAVSASFFKVRAVDVDGASRASREEIRASVVRLSQAGVWQADLEAISGELKNLPWVRDAVVSRVLPAGLRVRVTEREPRVISRTASGRLTWVDDDGVTLGAASPDDQEFFVRGIEESRAPDALKHNRARVALARELSRDWSQAGLAKRVSEVNLEDLEDVRVQLAGDDASVEVRLGREEYAKRLRQALEVLDAQRGTARAPFITYVDVSQGKRAVVGTGSTAHFPPSAPAADAEATRPTATAADATVKSPNAAPKEVKKKDDKKDEKKAARVGRKVTESAKRTDVAVRPRRVE
jgi:cell division septal protein FtsQ